MADTQQTVANEVLLHKMDLLLERLDHLERRLDALETGGVAEIGHSLELLEGALTDDMVKALAQKLRFLGEAAFSPEIEGYLSQLRQPEFVEMLQNLTDPKTLELLNGLLMSASLLRDALTDNMITELVQKIRTLAEVVLDPWVNELLVRFNRALKLAQATYPDVKVKPVGGVLAALRQANDPDSRRVAALMLAVIKQMGRELA